MRLLTLVLAAASLIAGVAVAAPVTARNGAEYTTLASPQPVQAVGKKVEVIEFFMYHCHFCSALEPTLAAWVKKQGDNIVFRRIHFPYTGPEDPEAHLYLTLEAMGKLDTMHDKVFRAIHEQHIRLNTDEKIADWVGNNGIDSAQYRASFSSIAVLHRLHRLANVVRNYGIESAPALVVDGRYLSSPSMVSAANPGLPEAERHKATMEVLDALVSKALADNAAKPAAQ